MEYAKTKRGFSIITFYDRYDSLCEIQESSLAGEDCIWLGVARADPKVLIKGRGWVEFPIPDDVLLNTRMHLTIGQVKDLIPVLQHFVETGEIPAESKSEVV